MSGRTVPDGDPRSRVRRRPTVPARAPAAPAPRRASTDRPGRMSSRRLGPAALGAGAVAYAALWIVARPAGEPAGRFIGELCGAEAVLLFSCSLVMATLLPFIERAFGGLDRVAVWHRRVAEAGMLLLIPHLALVTSSPDPYETSFGHGLGDVALL